MKRVCVWTQNDEEIMFNNGADVRDQQAKHRKAETMRISHDDDKTNNGIGGGGTSKLFDTLSNISGNTMEKENRYEVHHVNVK